MDIGKIIEKEKTGVWVQFTPSVRLQLKPLTPVILRKIIKKCTKTVFKSGVKNDELDEEKSSDLINEHVIADWEGITCNGEVFPCNIENINILLNNMPQLQAFITEQVDEIRKAEFDEAEAETKNS